MKTEVRERLFLPLMIPLGILAAIAVLVGGFAAILLWNTREGAIALAIAAAGGVLFAVSMLSARDDLDSPRKGVALLAGAIPVLVGAVLAFTGGGTGDESLLNINREPHATVPENAPVVLAENAQEFETTEIELAANVEVALVFQNDDVGVSHNVWIVGLQGDEADPSTEIFRGDIFAGPETQVYEFTAPEPGEYAFLCTVHPEMEGRVTFSEDSDQGIVEEA